MIYCVQVHLPESKRDKTRQTGSSNNNNNNNKGDAWEQASAKSKPLG